MSVGWSTDDLLPAPAQASPAAAPAATGPVALPGGGGVLPDGSTTNDPAVWDRWLKQSGQTAQPASPQQTQPAHQSASQGAGPGWSTDDLLPASVAASTGPQPPPGAGASPAAASPAQPPQEAQQRTLPPPPDWLTGTANAAQHAMTFGADDVILPAVGAGINAALRPIVGGSGSFGADYDRLQQQQRDSRAAFSQDSPVSSGVAGLVGGIGSAGVTAPLFGAAAPGAGLAARALNYGRNIAASSAVGGAAGFGEGEGGFDQRLQSAGAGAIGGAALGAALPPVLGGIGAGINAAKGIARGVAPLVSQGAQRATVGGQLADMVGGAPIQQAPLPVPLDLAQATGSPQAADLVRAANTMQSGQDAANAIRGQQQTGIRNALGTIAAPQTSAEASAGLTDAVRQADAVVARENTRRWMVPELNQQRVPVAPVARRVQAGLQAIPGLATKLDGEIGATVQSLAGFPEGATPRQLNKIASELRTLSRSPGLTMNDPSRARLAGRVAQMITDGIGDAISASPNAAGMQRAYAAARGFTRQTSPIMGTDDARGLLRTNGAGTLRKDASRGADAFFDFTRGGGEGVENLRQIHDMLRDIQNDRWIMQAVGHTPGDGMTAADVSAVRAQLLDHARSFVTARMADAVTDRAGVMQPNAITQWLRTNRQWIEGSGLFNRAQVQVFDNIGRTAEMIARPQNLRAGTNSATAEYLATKTMMSDMLSPWIGRLLKVGKFGAAATGLASGHLAEAGGAFVGGHMAEGLLQPAREAMRDMMIQAAHDPQIASDLMMRARPGNVRFLSPQTRALAQQLAARAGAELGRSLGQPAQQGDLSAQTAR